MEGQEAAVRTAVTGTPRAGKGTSRMPTVNVFCESTVLEQRLGEMETCRLVSKEQGKQDVRTGTAKSAAEFQGRLMEATPLPPSCVDLQVMPLTPTPVSSGPAPPSRTPEPYQPGSWAQGHHGWCEGHHMQICLSPSAPRGPQVGSNCHLSLDNIVLLPYRSLLAFLGPSAFSHNATFLE